MPEPFLVAEHVTVAFGGLVAVDDVTITADVGELVGVIGPNGAGKSTLFSAIAGTITARAGAGIRLGGDDVTRWPAHRRARAGLGRTFQRLEVFGSMTVRENFAFATEAGSLAGQPLRLLTRRSYQRPAVVDDALARLGLGDDADRIVGELPMGRRRMVELGRALCAEPRLILLDEPSSGLDRAETDELGEAMARIVGEMGIGIVLVEHDMDLVLGRCQQLFVLDFGRLIAEGPARHVEQLDVVRDAYLGDGVKLAPLLQANGVRAGYGGGGDVLVGVDLDIDEREVVALLGPNGAGKSTLLQVLAGFVTPTAGRIALCGRDVIGHRPDELARCGIYLLPEGRGVLPNLTVAENLRLATARPERQWRDALDRTLEVFPRLAERATQPAGTLSGGERQMLALARAFAARPRLLLLDEPSLGLAPKVVDEVFEIIGRFRDEDTAVVLVEQYVGRAIAVADRVLVLRKGSVSWRGAAADADIKTIARQYGVGTTP